MFLSDCRGDNGCIGTLTVKHSHVTAGEGLSSVPLCPIFIPDWPTLCSISNMKQNLVTGKWANWFTVSLMKHLPGWPTGSNFRVTPQWWMARHSIYICMTLNLSKVTFHGVCICILVRLTKKTPHWIKWSHGYSWSLLLLLCDAEGALYVGPNLFRKIGRNRFYVRGLQ